MVLSSYIPSAIAVLVMRQSRLTNYRPTFRVPFSPWLPIIGIICFTILIIDMGLAAVEISVGLLLIGLGAYFFYGRKPATMEQGSCVLTPFVAIPHIICNGEKRFRIMLVRSREGISFEDNAAVKAFFVIVGSRDMRHQHLTKMGSI